MSAIKLFAAGLCAAVVSTAFILVGSDPLSPDEAQRASRPSDSARRGSARPPATRREPGHARELADLRHQVRHLAEVGERAAAPPDPPAPEPPSPVEFETPEQTQQYAVNVAEAFDDHLSGEATDHGATATATAHIESTLTDSDAGGRLLDTECGQTLCRSRIGFEDLAQRDSSLQDIGTMMPWDADGFFHTDPDDDLSVSMYFTRAGQTLPPFDAT